jgi:hypothetical protein
VLPSLTGNLVWNTSVFKNSGTLAVVALTSPLISGVQLSGTNLILSGSGGPNSWPYFVLSATNLAAQQWTPIATNQFSPAGNFSFTNAIKPNTPQAFYKLQLQ